MNKNRAYELMNIRYNNISSFVNIIELNYRERLEILYRDTINYVLELIEQYVGALDIMWDLNVFTDEEIEQYLEFVGTLKAELIRKK